MSKACSEKDILMTKYHGSTGSSNKIYLKILYQSILEKFILAKFCVHCLKLIKTVIYIDKIQILVV